MVFYVPWLYYCSEKEHSVVILIILSKEHDYAIYYKIQLLLCYHFNSKIVGVRFQISNSFKLAVLICNQFVVAFWALLLKKSVTVP
jgi:hypothetical protein